MNPLLKKILLIVGLLAASALIAWGLYKIFKGTTPESKLTDKSIGTSTAGQLPSAGTRPTDSLEDQTGSPGQTSLPTGSSIQTTLPPTYYIPEAVSKISSDNAIQPIIDKNGNVRYSNPADGKFYQVAPDGTVKQLSDQVFYNVKNITWAPTANKAVLEYPDSSKIIYNFDTHSQVSLPKHWENFSFSANGTELAAKSIGLSPENRWIVTTKDDGTGTQLIEPIGNNADKITINWSPSRQAVAFADLGQPQGGDRKEILFVGLHGENFKSTIVEGLDFQPQWSPTGQKLLYSVDSARSNYKPELWIVNSFGDNIGANRTMLNINTWANKCAFGNDNVVFCGVPRELPQGAGMSPAIADNIKDDLYKIDLKTGLKTSVPMGGDFTIDSISYDTKNNKIIFTDKRQDGIFRVNL